MLPPLKTVAYPGIFFSGGEFTPVIFFGRGVQQIQLRIEVTEIGDLGTVVP
jgi:hypothetical protein